MTNTNGFADPVERPGAIDRGRLPVSQFLQQTSRQLVISFTGLPTGTKSAVLTRAFQPTGVVNNGILSLFTNASWTTRTSVGSTWYTGSMPYAGSGSVTYSMGVLYPTAADFYELEIGWGGAAGHDSGFKRFYVQVLSSLTSSYWKSDADGNWSDPANWSAGVPNSFGATARFDGAATAHRTITLDADYRVGNLEFNNPVGYTLAGTHTLSIDPQELYNGRILVSGGDNIIAVPLELTQPPASPCPPRQPWSSRVR